MSSKLWNWWNYFFKPLRYFGKLEEYLNFHESFPFPWRIVIFTLLLLFKHGQNDKVENFRNFFDAFSQIFCYFAVIKSALMTFGHIGWHLEGYKNWISFYKKKQTTLNLTRMTRKSTNLKGRNISVIEHTVYDVVMLVTQAAKSNHN